MSFTSYLRKGRLESWKRRNWNVLQNDFRLNDPTIPMIFPLSGLTVRPRSSVKIEPLRLTECAGKFTVVISALYGRVSLPHSENIIQSIPLDGQPGVSLVNGSAYDINLWFSNLFYQNIMYDTKPYTDYVTVSIFINREIHPKIATIPIRVQHINIPLFVSSLKARSDLTLIIPEPDDFEARTTAIIKVR